MATYNGTTGNDSITGSTSADLINANAGNDTVNAGDGNDSIYGGDGADLISGGNQNDTIDGGTGNDTVTGGAGADTVTLGAGDDVFGDWSTEGGNDLVYGGDGNDAIIGGGEDDTVYGDAGNDTLSGGAGSDNLSGGADADSFLISDDHNYDAIDGGETGNDWDSVWFGNYTSTLGVNVTFSGTGSGSYAFLGTTGNGVFNGIEAIGGTDYADTLNAASDGGGVDLYGGGGADSITGGAGADWLEGDGGNDTLIGGAGADELYGGAGNDSMSGNGDGDIFWIDQISGTDTIIGGESGADSDVLSLASTAGSAVSVTLTGAEAGSFSFANSVGNGGTFSQIEGFWLGAGNDSFNGAASTAAMSVSGNAGADTITGGSGNDTLDGGEGSDSLSGGAGADLVSGGAGADTLSGGAGNDTLSGGDDGDRFVIGPADGTDSITGGEGGADGDSLSLASTANSGVTVTLTGAEAGSYSFAGSVGNGGTFSQIETFSLGAGNDSFNGAASAAPMSVAGNGGADTITGGGGADTLDGGDGNDSLSGGAGADAMSGGAGADVVSGGIGADTLRGGAGDDTLTGGGDHDVIMVEVSSGRDVVTDFDLGDDNGDGFTNDRIDVSELRDAQGGPVTRPDVSISDDGSGNAVLGFPNGERVVLQGVSPSVAGGRGQLYAMGIPCFVEGTRILTPDGEVPVERIAAGMPVQTVDHGPMPVLWVGSWHATADDLAADPELRPVVVRRNTLGNRRPLRISSHHALVVRRTPDDPGVFARARQLALGQDGRFRVALPGEGVTYWHLLLGSHQVIVAEGAETESFYPGPVAMRSLPDGSARAVRAALAAVGVTGVDDAALATAYGPRARATLAKRDVLRLGRTFRRSDTGTGKPGRPRARAPA